MTQQYSRLWHVEQATPAPEESRQYRTTDPAQMTGFWRIVGAKMKPDYPVMIWRQDGKDAVIFQIGRQKPMNTAEHADKFAEFCQNSWLKCVAVSYADCQIALDTGRWPDGKMSRQLTEDEKLGISQPVEDRANDTRSIDARLGDEIAALVEAVTKQGEPADQAAADKLSGDLDLLRGLLKRAESERVTEKEPHLRASREVDARWGAITKPGQDAYDAAEKRRRAFLRKEQERRDAEVRAENERRRRAAEEAARIERERIEAETRERLEREAAEKGETVSEADAKAIGELAAEAAAQVEAPPVEEVQPERVTAGSAFGRSTGLKKVKRGEIEDMDKFRNAPSIARHGDVIELLHKLADRAARAGIEIEGMKIVEGME